MAILKTVETGSSGPGKTTSPNKILDGVTGGVSGAVGKVASAIGNAVSTAKTAAGERGTVSSSNWSCPSGSVLTYESNGSGNLVCLNTTTGRETSAVRASGGGGTISPGGGSTGGGGAASGGGVSGTGTPGGTGSSAGAASRYLQAGADTFARNPEAMLADNLYQRYGDAGNGLYEMLKPYADAMNVLFLASSGNDAAGGTKDDFLNYLDSAWTALQTPGARLDAAGALQNIMNPAAGSPLEAYLSGGNPEDQAGNLLRLVAGAMQTGYHPLIANAVMDRLGLEADRYMGQSAREQVDPFYKSIQTTVPSLRRLLPYG